MRISRQQLFMEIAGVVAKRSTCFRLNVGAVVVVDDRIVSLGYNGSARGEPHCSGNTCPGRFRCDIAIHAEVNALRHVPSSVEEAYKDLYVTDSPCVACTDLILRSKVRRVFYGTLYRINEHLKDVPNLYQVLPSGWVVDHHTKDIVDSIR